MCRKLLNLGAFWFLVIRWGIPFSPGYHNSGVPFPGSNTSKHITLLSLISSDTNPNHLVEVISAGFLHCIATSFIFVINTFLGENTLKYANILFFIKLFPQTLKLTLAYIYGSCLQQFLLWCSSGNFLFPVFLPHLLTNCICKGTLSLLLSFNH